LEGDNQKKKPGDPRGTALAFFGWLVGGTV